MLIIPEQKQFDDVLLSAASWYAEGGDGASAGGHASDRSPVCLFPQ